MAATTRKDHQVVRLRGVRYTAKALAEALNKVTAGRYTVDQILDSGSAYTVVASRTVRVRGRA